MNDIVIKAENLGKKYTIGHQAESGRYVALRDVLMQNARTLWNKTKDLAKGKAIIQGDTLEEVWALKDVSFEINRGEAVGIIGRNGAGKSTLLKILSRITEPSTGRVTIKGRVASLLEVGTGFHPELTGRENIYLNGTILGMTRVEIKRKFDEIVAFAELEKFIDTPVKRYSSGMYMRLAFAVAAHLEPEILLVDEVLAVGDAAFQKKCLGKMGEVSKEGRTVLFVSHNMGAVTRLCEYCILLERGQIEKKGVPTEVIDLYISKDIAFNQAERTWDFHERMGDESCRLIGVRICQPSGVLNSSIDITRPFEIEINTQSDRIETDLAISLQILTADGSIALHTADLTNSDIIAREPGRRVSCCEFPAQLLNAGTYFLSIGCDIPNKRMIFLAENIISFNVQNPSPEIGKYSSSSWKGIMGPGIARWILKT